MVQTFSECVSKVAEYLCTGTVQQHRLVAACADTMHNTLLLVYGFALSELCTVGPVIRGHPSNETVVLFY